MMPNCAKVHYSTENNLGDSYPKIWGSKLVQNKPSGFYRMSNL